MRKIHQKIISGSKNPHDSHQEVGSKIHQKVRSGSKKSTQKSSAWWVKKSTKKSSADWVKSRVVAEHCSSLLHWSTKNAPKPTKKASAEWVKSSFAAVAGFYINRNAATSPVKAKKWAAIKTKAFRIFANPRRLLYLVKLMNKHQWYLGASHSMNVWWLLTWCWMSVKSDPSQWLWQQYISW